MVVLTSKISSANAPSWYKGDTEEGQTYHVVQLYWKDTGAVKGD